MKILAGTSNPGNTNAVIPALEELVSRGHDVVAIGERDSSAPRFDSYSKYQSKGFRTESLEVEGIERYTVEEAKKLLENEKPDVIVTSGSRPSPKLPKEEYTIDQVLIQAGNEMGIPVVVVEDIWGSYVPRNSDEHVHVCVLDKSAIALVAKNAPKAEKIYVTGNPAFDEYSKIDVRSKRNEVRQKLGIEGKRLIAYGGQVSPNNPETLKWVVDNLGENDVLYFGMHPRANRDYTAILAKAGDKLITAEQAKSKLGTNRFDDVMYGADVVVTHFSTVCLTAAFYGIDVINVHVKGDANPEGLESIVMPYEYPLVVSGASVGASTSDEYSKAIANIESMSEKLAKGRKSYVSGTAAKKVATVVEEVGKRKN